MSKLDSCPHFEELADSLVPSEASRLVLEHVAHCETCRAEREALLSMVAPLKPQAGEFDDAERAAAIIEQARTRTVAPFRRLPSTRAVLSIALAASVVVASTWLYMAQTQHARDSGFASRGGDAASSDRWSSLTVFHTTPGGRDYPQVHRSIAAGDALLFAITNQPGSPHRYVMILGIDENGRLFWFHPERIVGTDAKSIPIGVAAEPQELREEIRLPIASKWLRIVALFSPHALSATNVEQALRHQTALSFADVELSGADPDIGIDSQLLEVQDPRGEGR